MWLGWEWGDTASLARGAFKPHLVFIERGKTAETFYAL